MFTTAVIYDAKVVLNNLTILEAKKGQKAAWYSLILSDLGS